MKSSSFRRIAAVTATAALILAGTTACGRGSGDEASGPKVVLAISTLNNPFFVELGRNMDQLSGSHATRLVHSALDVLVTMLSQELHRQHGTVGDPTRSLAQEVREYIIARLGDEDLTPAAIAKAARASTGSSSASSTIDAACR